MEPGLSWILYQVTEPNPTEVLYNPPNILTLYHLMQVVLRSPNISSLAKIVSTQYLISSYDPGHYQINVALKSLIEILFSLSINPANNNRHVRNV